MLLPVQQMQGIWAMFEVVLETERFLQNSKRSLMFLELGKNCGLKDNLLTSHCRFFQTFA